MKLFHLSTLAFLALGTVAQAQNAGTDPLKDVDLSTFSFRSVGPALTSGRIADLAVDPTNTSTWYIAAAAGGVWKTTNSGTTFSPLFDNQGSFSIGCVTLDPNNPNVVWVGSGENNNQRSANYGDGVYKSVDGGKSWKNMGLKNSEHIGMIKVDPRNSEVIFVAAYGPLWSSGGDRGLYKSKDGGKTWNRVLHVSEHTGFNEVHLDPRNPDWMYATAHQRRRHVWTYLSGGPESAVYHSKDGGETWNKLQNGLPGGDVGRIALAISPANPDYVYALVEGHGFYRSTNRGGSFEKRSSHETSGNYYCELVPHPTDPETVYSMDTYAQVTTDGGKTFKGVGESKKHVDNHCLWIDPSNPNHLVMGCDGGIYETYDLAQNWNYKPNLPVTQFYKVSVDQALPFYNIYGGTQDNFSLAGPSRTLNTSGITNADWIVTQSGDGFESQPDPTNPDIVYAQAQYGVLVRFDKKSGEGVGIQPMADPGSKPYRWNWDAPLLISPHNHKRLYFAANIVFRSDDQGNTWKEISGDLTQQIDRNQLPIMGRSWSMDAVARNQSTSIYGNLVALDESPVQENLLYVGSDDGIMHRSTDAGGKWTKLENFPGVPKNTYVNMIVASRHNANTVYVAFNNHKNGDFKPYLLKSTDQGNTWTAIQGNLPERGSVYSIAEDPVKPGLLFAGTEFGCYFSPNDGKNWYQLGAGLPTACVRDMAIQDREDDLVLATFGRGFYVLDDISPLRQLTAEALAEPVHFFDTRDGLVYLPANPLGYGGVGFMGASFYTAPNPEIGATLVFNVNEAPKTRKAKRKEEEKKKQDQGADIPYPSAEAIRLEDQEEAPYFLLSIANANGREIRRITLAASSGLHKVTWDGRLGSVANNNTNGSPMTNANEANLALPGTYTATLWQSVDGKLTKISEPHTFMLRALHTNTLLAPNMEELQAFQREADSLDRTLTAANQFVREFEQTLSELKAATRNTPNADLSYMDQLRDMEKKLNEANIALFGDRSLQKREFPIMPSLNDRMGEVLWNSFYSTSAPTDQQRKNIAHVRDGLNTLLPQLRELELQAQSIQTYLEYLGAPYLKGSIPHLKR